MWNADHDELGFLVYGFADTVDAMHPYVRLRGRWAGLLYLARRESIMAYNLFAHDPGRPARMQGRRSRSAHAVRGGMRRADQWLSGSITKKIETHATLLMALSVWSWSALAESWRSRRSSIFENTIEKVQGHAALHPAGAGRAATSTSARAAIPVIQPDDPARCATRWSAMAISALAAESMYDHPFQWGSKRTGPDLARVGGRYSDDWHVDHMIEDPRSVVPESIMPSYGFHDARKTAGLRIYRRRPEGQPRRGRALYR